MLLVVGCSYRTAPVEVRERLAFGQDRLLPALDALVAHCGCEAVILSTCNRVELYLARDDGGPGPDSIAITRYLSDFHRVAIPDFSSCLYEYRQAEAMNHLFHPKIVDGIRELTRDDESEDDENEQPCEED